MRSISSWRRDPPASRSSYAELWNTAGVAADAAGWGLLPFLIGLTGEIYSSFRYVTRLEGSAGPP